MPDLPWDDPDADVIGDVRTFVRAVEHGITYGELDQDPATAQETVKRHAAADTSPAPFAFTPLGPYTAPDGRWCCGLACTGYAPGVPCPYGLKIRPRPT